MKIEISREQLKLVSEALATQIRLIDAYINKEDDQIIRMMKFHRVKYVIDALLLDE